METPTVQWVFFFHTVASDAHAVAVLDLFSVVLYEDLLSIPLLDAVIRWIRDVGSANIIVYKGGHHGLQDPVFSARMMAKGWIARETAWDWTFMKIRPLASFLAPAVFAFEDEEWTCWIDTSTRTD
jgi:hypothetical protein